MFLFDGCAGEQQLKRTPGNAFEGFCLLIAPLVNSREGISLLKDCQIPRNRFGLVLMSGGKIVGCDDYSILEEWIRVILRDHSVPLGVVCQNYMRDRIELIDQFLPLEQ